MKLGGVNYLTKPVKDDGLITAIDRALIGGPGHLPDIPRADGVARWARAMANVLEAPHDPKTLNAWSAARQIAPETLRGWCRTAALSPKASLDLARILRAVWQARARGWPICRLLDVADRRTLSRLFEAAGLSTTHNDAQLPTLDEVLRRQHLITDPVAIDELWRVLRENNVL